MSAIFLYLTEPYEGNSVLRLAGAAYHHLARVRRVRVGDLLRAALPDGRVLAAEITAITAEAITARVVSEEAPAGLSPCRITLAQAVLKGEKMEQVVQKATELGVWRIIPLLAARAIPRWTPAQAAERADRWQRIAEAACEQCERSLPPQVTAPLTLADALRETPTPRLLLHERDGDSLHDYATRESSVPELALFLGPEGGWTPEETAHLRAAGATPIHLGGRILRAETASLVTITLAQYLWGDL